MKFIPHGATCEADDGRGADFGKCGELAVMVVSDDKGRDRYVCGFHWRYWLPEGAIEKETLDVLDDMAQRLDEE